MDPLTFIALVVLIFGGSYAASEGVKEDVKRIKEENK